MDQICICQLYSTFEIALRKERTVWQQLPSLSSTHQCKISFIIFFKYQNLQGFPSVLIVKCQPYICVSKSSLIWCYPTCPFLHGGQRSEARISQFRFQLHHLTAVLLCLPSVCLCFLFCKMGINIVPI